MSVKYLSLACATVLLGLPLAGVSRDTSMPAAVEDVTVVGKSAVSEQVKTLAAMSGPERKAAIKQMDADERRGLWFEAKRYQAEQRMAQRGGVKKSGQSRKQGQKLPTGLEPGDQWKRAKAVGTIQYDSGLPTTSFNSGSIIGNRFNTHTGIPVFASGTVSTVQALVVPGSANTTQSAGFVLEGPQTTMGGALAIFSTFTSAGTGALETVNFSGIGANFTGSSFFVLFGDFNNSYVPAFGPGTTLGQGHHGVLADTGGMGPNVTAITPLTTLNAFIRATGNIVPVELMNFSVD